jgi:hypothetical protein
MANGQYIAGGPTPFIVSETGADQYVYNGTIVDETSGGTAYTLSLGSGTFTFTGASMGLVVNRELSLGSGSYTFSGAPMSFGVELSVQLGSGAYAFTGSPLTLVYSPGAVQSTGGGTSRLRRRVRPIWDIQRELDRRALEQATAVAVSPTPTPAPSIIAKPQAAPVKWFDGPLPWHSVLLPELPKPAAPAAPKPILKIRRSFAGTRLVEEEALSAAARVLPLIVGHVHATDEDRALSFVSRGIHGHANAEETEAMFALGRAVTPNKAVALLHEDHDQIHSTATVNDSDDDEAIELLLQ